MDNIQAVATIGAGISGVCAAAHLLKEGLSVTVYERSSIAGGVRHFDSRSPFEPSYPNELPSKGDYESYGVGNGESVYNTLPGTPHRGSTLREATDVDRHGSLDPGLKWQAQVAHAPPGPCYLGLKNNVSLTCMKTSLRDWPQGLEEFVSQNYLEEYIQGIAQDHCVNLVTKYGSRVEDVHKNHGQWRLKTTLLNAKSLPKTNISYFDAVVVASGHYNMPRVPNIPGLTESRLKSPDRFMHSKGYRDASKYQDKCVLLIGAGVSSMDIAKEIVRVGGYFFQSSRGGMFDLPAGMLPDLNARRVGGVRGFIADAHGSPRVVLTSGEQLDVDYVILATGYITSYPLLPQLHSDSSLAEQVDNYLLVTKEGDMVHNLYRDIFYIPDSSLCFVGVPYYISTFSLFEFQARSVAKVLSGRARLPERENMYVEYDQRVSLKGYCRDFHSLRAEGAEIEYVSELIQWVNKGLSAGEQPMNGHTKEWVAGHRMQREMLKARQVLRDTADS